MTIITQFKVDQTYFHGVPREWHSGAYFGTIEEAINSVDRNLSNPTTAYRAGRVLVRVPRLEGNLVVGVESETVVYQRTRRAK